jgi:hypothetical protein
MLYVYNFKTSQLFNILEDEPFAKRDWCSTRHNSQATTFLTTSLLAIGKAAIEAMDTSNSIAISDSHSPTILPVVNLNARIQNTFVQAIIDNSLNSKTRLVRVPPARKCILYKDIPVIQN